MPPKSGQGRGGAEVRASASEPGRFICLSHILSMYTVTPHISISYTSISLRVIIPDTLLVRCIFLITWTMYAHFNHTSNVNEPGRLEAPPGYARSWAACHRASDPAAVRNLSPSRVMGSRGFLQRVGGRRDLPPKKARADICPRES